MPRPRILIAANLIAAVAKPLLIKASLLCWSSWCLFVFFFPEISLSLQLSCLAVSADSTPKPYKELLAEQKFQFFAPKNSIPVTWGNTTHPARGLGAALWGFPCSVWGFQSWSHPALGGFGVPWGEEPRCQPRPANTAGCEGRVACPPRGVGGTAQGSQGSYI